MFRFTLTLTVFLLLSARPALAQFDSGVSALRAGNYTAAQTFWQSCPEDGRCLYSLGYLAQFGLGRPADLAAAKAFYTKAAAKNDGDALYALGQFAEAGKTEAKDLAAALKNYRAAAATGTCPDAEYAVGRMILQGRGTPRDPVQALKWLRQAAGHHQVAAEYMLGEAYESGWGVPANRVEAYYWYRRAQEGDQTLLAEEDLEFQPAVALKLLRRHLTAAQIRHVEERLAREKR